MIKTLRFLLLSIGLHLMVLSVATNLQHFDLFKNLSRNVDKPRETIELQQISADEFKRIKIRQLGVKNGKKTSDFSLPSGPKIRKQLLKKSSSRQGGFSLTDLKVSKNDVPNPSKKIEFKSPPKKAEKPGHTSRFTRNVEIVQKQNFRQTVKEDLSKIASLSVQNARIVNNSNFDIRFEPPEGISEDELNKIEQIFYSFKKRTFETYLTSFLNQLQNFERKYPHFGKSYRILPHVLLGKVTFDKDGHITTIRFIQSSKNDKIQELFEGTLQGMNGLPNPPKAFIEKGGNFNIYYKLDIRG